MTNLNRRPRTLELSWCKRARIARHEWVQYFGRMEPVQNGAQSVRGLYR